MDQNSWTGQDTFAKDKDLNFCAIPTKTSIFEFKDFSNEIKISLCSFIGFDNAEGATK